MAFQTANFASASSVVCGHGGVQLRDLTDAALVQVQRDLGEARRALDALVAEVAGVIGARAEAAPGPGGIARRVGYKNAQDLIADTLGGTKGEAYKLTSVGRVLAAADAAELADAEAADAGLADAGGAGGAGAVVSPEAPRVWVLVAAAVRDASLTVEKAEILTSTLDTLRASAEVEAQFVRIAKRLRPYELRRVCARELVLNDPAGAEERERRLYEARYLNLTERIDGMTEVEGLLDPLTAGQFRAWLDAQVRAAFRAKRDTPGDERKPGQMRADALAMLAHHAMVCEAPGSGAPATLVARIAFEDLKSGLGFGTCDSLQTPISASTLRAMAVDAQIIPAVMGGDSVPMDLGRARRLATPYQGIAVLERDGGCAWCHAPASYCDKHHIIGWDDGGTTNIDNLVMLCVSCHHRIHFGRWRIEVRQGVVWFIPPADIDPTRTPRKGGLAHLDLAA